ncbi:MAG: hypothetical protein PHR56_00465, partial [Dehalococcoidales bacterium]|nr:hypothetical protein [Dehalococcoidales bacterium]
MDLILEGIVQAFQALIHGDPAVVQVAALSLVVSLTATVISLFLGVTLGTVIGLTRFFGRRFLVSLINTGMGAPPAVVGLIVMIMLWRNGPLGVMHLLYTPYAIV